VDSIFTDPVSKRSVAFQYKFSDEGINVKTLYDDWMTKHSGSNVDVADSCLKFENVKVIGPKGAADNAGSDAITSDLIDPNNRFKVSAPTYKEMEQFMKDNYDHLSKGATEYRDVVKGQLPQIDDLVSKLKSLEKKVQNLEGHKSEAPNERVTKIIGDKIKAVEKEVDELKVKIGHDGDGAAAKGEVLKGFKESLGDAQSKDMEILEEEAAAAQARGQVEMKVSRMKAEANARFKYSVSYKLYRQISQCNFFPTVLLHLSTVHT